MTKLLYLFFICSLLACNSTNKNSGNAVKDSLSAVISSEESIITYAEGLNNLKESLEKIESPVYNQGDYTFYFVGYKKDRLPVIYEEYGSSGSYGFNNKTYYLQNGEIVLYQEKSKQTIIGDKPSFEFKDLRIFYRNAIFLKADERSAESDSLLNSKPYTKVEESLIDKNKFYDFSRIEKGLSASGEYALTFDRINQNAAKKFLIMNSSQGIESSYLIKKSDSLIYKLEEQPEVYRGTKLKINYKRQGTNMIYDGEQLAH
jgi:hypothetical protein